MSDRLQQSAAWHTRLQSDAATEADFTAFAAWVADPLNRASYDQIDRAWASVDADPRAFAEAVAEPRASHPIRTGLAALAVCAAAAAALLIVAPHLTAPRWSSYAATSEDSRAVQLADATMLHLNRGASVQIAYAHNMRHVRMQGEVAFDVHHDARRPFMVHVGDQQIRVLGTEFNVLHANGATTVTVRRGVVSVSPIRGGVEPIALHVGEQGIYQDGVWRVTGADANAALAWREGRLIYDNAPLHRIVADLNRYVAKPIRIADPDLAQVRFSGVLAIEPEEQAVDRLQDLLPLTVRRTETETQLHPR